MNTLQRENENQETRPKLRKYLHVASQLREQIDSGHYPEGSQLPTEPELENLFKVSRVTVRTAMGELEDEGYISRQVGRGTFVTKKESAAKNRPGVVMLLLIGVSPKNAYESQEIAEMERHLSSLGVPCSWAVLTQEDVILGRFPAMLVNGLCAGVIVDGKISDAHLKALDRFDVAIMVAGNHDISRNRAQIRVCFDTPLRELMRELAQAGFELALALEPMVYALSHEIYHTFSEETLRLGQREHLFFLCESEQPHPSLLRQLRETKSKIAVITTDVIYARLTETLAADGRDYAHIRFVLLTSVVSQRECPFPTYRIVSPNKKFQDRAAECLLELIRGERTEIFEEFACDVIRPDEN